MSQAPAEDPSMEDVLASIRRILNDEPVAPDAAAPGQAEHQASPEPDVFVLDQTMLIEEPHVPDEPAFAANPMDHARTDRHESAPAPNASEPLLAPSSAAAATASMGALVRVLGQQQTPVYRGGPTLEDMVRDEIRPLVKNWLDENLPAMVERMVRAEIARVTGAAS